jgi:hypothetical protein
MKTSKGKKYQFSRVVYTPESYLRHPVQIVREMWRQYRSVKPPSPQLWGSQICESPPGLGDARQYCSDKHFYLLVEVWGCREIGM